MNCEFCLVIGTHFSPVFKIFQHIAFLICRSLRFRRTIDLLTIQVQVDIYRLSWVPN